MQVLPDPRQPVVSSMDGLGAALEIAREFGRHAGRTWYAGAVLDRGRDLLIVHRRPHPDFDGPLQALLCGRAPLELWPARFTRDELVDVREQVWSLDEILEIDTVVLPQDGSGLLVHVGGSVTRAQTELDRIALGVAVALPPRGAAALR
jgi:hypothetical protein